MIASSENILHHARSTSLVGPPVCIPGAHLCLATHYLPIASAERHSSNKSATPRPADRKMGFASGSQYDLLSKLAKLLESSPTARKSTPGRLTKQSLPEGNPPCVERSSSSPVARCF